MLRRLNWKSLLAIAIVMALAGASLAVQKININVPGLRLERGTDEILGLQLGLDLSGGIHLVYQAGNPDSPPTGSQMAGLLRIIRNRVDGLGATEPNIQQLGEDRVLVQLPGLQDVERAKRLLGETASLRVVERVCLDLTCGNHEDLDTGLTGEDLGRAVASTDTVTGQPIVLFDLNRGAARAFAELTQRIYDTNDSNSPDQLAFFLDDRELVSAGVRQPILSGSGQITIQSVQEARDLAIQLESGRLPIPIQVLTESVVDASLGSRSLQKSLVAGLVGLALVLFFMSAYYRMSGLLSAISLVFYATIVLSVFKLVPITLTLAGIGGFILSMGMAVDASILIFERMKEEVRVGRTAGFALQTGFQRAWPSIRDGNLSTLIIAVILYWFGTQFAASAVTGFAVALFIGVLTSMFTAIVITRSLMSLCIVTPLGRYLRLFTPESLPKRSQNAPTVERGGT